MHRLTILVFSVCLRAAMRNLLRRRKTGRSGAGRREREWRRPGDYPVKFSSTEGVAWKAKLPGVGTSTPAVWGDRIFVTCGIKGDGGEVRDGVMCFDMNGKELWRHEFGPERKGKNQHASGSNPSPVTDGENLVVYYKTGTLACLDLAGKEKWKINLQDKYGKDTLWWDLGTSPVLAGRQGDRGRDAGRRFVSGRG